jgi:hypothetical protein
MDRFPPSPRETGTSDRTFGDRIYKRYGFVDAFHPNNAGTDPDVIVIDVGITLLSAENLRRGMYRSGSCENGKSSG